MSNDFGMDGDGGGEDVMMASRMARALLDLIVKHGDKPVKLDGGWDCYEPEYDAETDTFTVN